MEFTIQNGKLWMLQTRNGKRTGAAMVQVSRWKCSTRVMIDAKTAVLRVEPAKLDELLHPVFDKTALKQANIIAKGLPASPGAASGQIVFFADDAEKWAERRQRDDPRPHRNLSGRPEGHELLPNGILTARGGMTSHAAVVARGMGKCCVSGAGDLQIDYKDRTITVGNKTYKEGDWISLNGSTGHDLRRQGEPRTTPK